MNPYDGLNLPQLLDLMHGLVMPEPVSWTPQTVGWLVACVWLIALAGVSGGSFFRRWRKNRYRREALAALADIEDQPTGDNAADAAQIAALVKRTSLAAYSRPTVANLHGEAWARFLCESADNDPEVERGAGLIAIAAYRSGVDGAALLGPARRWIELHRA